MAGGIDPEGGNAGGMGGDTALGFAWLAGGGLAPGIGIGSCGCTGSGMLRLPQVLQDKVHRFFVVVGRTVPQ